MHPRDEISRILNGAGQPPPIDVGSLERRVRARLDAVSPIEPSRTWWRSWTTGGLVAAGLACGFWTAAWRVGPEGGGEPADGHVRYLQLIDPLVRAAGGGNS